jgi:16S rRNA (cytosine1402-N4)-methyltransferase
MGTKRKREESSNFNVQGNEIYIKYLPTTATEKDVADFFAEAGEIVGEVRLMKNPATGQSKGAGFVTFASRKARDEAVSWDGCEWSGRHLSISVATTSWHGVKGTMQEAGTHTPAMRDAVVEAMVGKEVDGTYVDGTFGRGGHSRAILQRLSKKGRLIAFDLDPEAIKVAKNLEAEDKRFSIVHRPFGDMAEVLRERGVEPSGVFLDLGISSPQFDDASRGFRPEEDGPLDLRFDATAGESAYEFLQRVERNELIRILCEAGETQDPIAARRIADAIVLKARTGGLPKRTKEFARLVARAKGKEYQQFHPAKMAFQAIRIYLNREFEQCRSGLEGAFATMVDGGRLGLLTWKHSEAAIVVDFAREHEAAREDQPLLSWLRAEHPKRAKKLRKRAAIEMDDAARPTQQEIAENSRSRSAILHVLRKRTALRLDDVEKEAYEILGWN